MIKDRVGQIRAQISNTTSDFDKEKLEFIYDGKDELTSLNRKDQKIGTMTVKYNDEELDSFDVILTEDIEFSLDKYLADYRTYIIGAIFIVCALVVGLIVKSKISAKQY